MPDPRQEMARRILEERGAMAQRILAERRGGSPPAPAPSKVIQMPVQQIEGQVPQTPLPSGPKAEFNETMNMVTASAYPHLYGAANAGLDWAQEKIGPGAISDWIQGQQRSSLGRGRGIASSPADTLEGQGSAAYRDAMRAQIEQGRAQQPADARAGMGAGAAGLGSALAGRSLGGTAARAGAYGTASGAAESDGDVGTALKRGGRDAAVTAAFGGLGKLAARLQAERAAKAAQEAARASQGAPPVMESLREGARRTAHAIGTRVLPAAGTAYAAKALGAPNMVPGIMAAAMAPHILRGAKAAGTAALAGTNPAALGAAGKLSIGMLESGDQPGPQRYDPRALEVVRRRRATEQRNAGIDRVRQAFVDQSMSEPLRAFVGPAIEEGADYKRMAAKLEEASASPELAAELEKLLGARKGEKNEQ